MTEGTTLGIIGTGLIGGSIGLRARELNWNVIGVDRRADAADEALARGAIAEIVSVDELYRRADTIAIATPPRATIAELEQMRAQPPRASLILDVASVKQPIVDAAGGLANFVATHPLAGSERSGAAAASAHLFTGRAWIYVPPANRALETRVTSFITAMSARPVTLDAGSHDALLALTSHVPQLLATIFGKAIRQQRGDDVERFCGPVARELLRLADSNVQMWREVFDFNKANVAKHARDLAARLEAAARALAQESGAEKPNADG